MDAEGSKGSPRPAEERVDAVYDVADVPNVYEQPISSLNRGQPTATPSSEVYYSSANETGDNKEMIPLSAFPGDNPTYLDEQPANGKGKKGNAEEHMVYNALYGASEDQALLYDAPDTTNKLIEKTPGAQGGFNLGDNPNYSGEVGKHVDPEEHKVYNALYGETDEEKVEQVYYSSADNPNKVDEPILQYDYAVLPSAKK